eukprot:358110-Chlamydomonas_euryale.AAC.3
MAWTSAPLYSSHTKDVPPQSQPYQHQNVRKSRILFFGTRSGKGQGWPGKGGRKGRGSIGGKGRSHNQRLIGRDAGMGEQELRSGAGRVGEEE